MNYMMSYQRAGNNYVSMHCVLLKNCLFLPPVYNFHWQLNISLIILSVLSLFPTPCTHPTTAVQSADTSRRRVASYNPYIPCTARERDGVKRSKVRERERERGGSSNHSHEESFGHNVSLNSMWSII